MLSRPDRLRDAPAGAPAPHANLAASADVQRRLEVATEAPALALVTSQPTKVLRFKRVLDVVLAVVALLLLGVIMLIVAILIRVDSPGPVLFRQRRVGRGGREFTMLKYRTMVADADQQRAALLALSRDPSWLDLASDPRITRVGRFLRLSSLDELPQFWNVLRGDMSLVGPRPLIPPEHAHLPRWAQDRVCVPPGVTGLWQVSGRASISFEEMLRLDCAYIRSVSITTDLAILLRTIPAVLSRRGAN